MSDVRQSQLLEFGAGVTSYSLTTSYVASSPVPVGKGYQIGLDVSYAAGAAETANTIELKVEVSNIDTTPGTNDWFQLISTSTTTGVSTVSLQNYIFTQVATGGTADTFHISFPCDFKWFRVSAKEGGVSSNAGTLIVRFAKSEDYR